MKLILAVSGGVDSMAMLEIMRLKLGWSGDLVIAHFNHGMRPSAKDDEELVRRKAEEYGIPIVVGYGELGPEASEAEARAARYEFLKRVAADNMEEEMEMVGDGMMHVHRERAPIMVAHHLNDLAETVMINLIRGTGWRGLAVMNMEGVERPFIEMEVTKREVYIVAGENELEFRDDPTNNDEKYLRNQVREEINKLSKMDLLELKDLRDEQVQLKEEIEEVASIIANQVKKGKSFSREAFREMDDDVADEVLIVILKSWNVTATRPQRKDFLEAIRTYESGKKFNLPQGVMVKIKQNKFEL